jgi:hypothetical protein
MFDGVLVIDDGPHVSADWKPLPEIETVPPALTELGLSVIVGAGMVTLNVAEIDGPGTTPGSVKMTW